MSLSLRPPLSRVPCWIMTRRGCQGATSGLPTRLAGGMSHLITSWKRWELQSFHCSFHQCFLHPTSHRPNQKSVCDNSPLVGIFRLGGGVLFFNASEMHLQLAYLLFGLQSAHSHNPSHQSHNTMIVTSSSSSSATTPHRVVGQQGYDGMMNKGGQYQPGMPLSVVPSGGPGQYQGNMSQGNWLLKRKGSLRLYKFMLGSKMIMWGREK